MTEIKLLDKQGELYCQATLDPAKHNKLPYLLKLDGRVFVLQAKMSPLEMPTFRETETVDLGSSAGPTVYTEKTENFRQIVRKPPDAQGRPIWFFGHLGDMHRKE